MSRYSIQLDVDKDAQNWYQACKGGAGLRDWTKQVEPELLKRVNELDEVAAIGLLKQHVTQLHRERAFEIEEYTQRIRTEFEQKFHQACQKIEDLTQKPLYREDFTIYLTTFPRGPYDYGTGALWIAIGWFDPIKNFMHEALHFQFIHYWAKNDGAVRQLSKSQFQTLKESLTVVLDKDIEPLIKSPDKGYESHHTLREALHKNWVERHDFSRLVDEGVRLVKAETSS